MLAGSSSAATAVEITPSGRLHLDYARHDSDVTQFDDRFLVRRAQLGLEAKFSHDWSAKLVYDFAAGGSVKDAYLRYGGWKRAEFTLGQFKVPFGLEQLSSTNETSFIEKALPSAAFSLSRRKGLGLESHGPRHTFAAMGFGSSIGGNEGRGAAARFTFTPVNHGQTLLHLGLAASTEWPSAPVNFGARPEALPTDVRLLRTGTIGEVGRIDQLSLEAAWRQGPWSLQSESMHSHLRRNLGNPDLNFHGWYVAGSWLLTGEARDYHDGVFKGVTPAGRGGAWELTARYSHLGLDDGTVRGGNENNVTLGVNWYCNDHLRFMVNYIRVNSERHGIADDPSLVDARAQITF